MTQDRTDDVIRNTIHELVATAPEPKPLAAPTRTTESSKRWLASVAALLLIGAAMGASALLRNDSPGGIATDPDIDATPWTTPETTPSANTVVTATPSITPSTAPGSRVVATPPTSAPVPGSGPSTPEVDPITAASYVAVSPDGVEVSTDKVHWTATRETAPSEGRALLIDRFVVHQPSTPNYPPADAISIITADGIEVWSRPGWYVKLFDVGFVDGDPTMLVSTGTQLNSGPDGADVRLLLVDLATRTEIDLGSIGGWETGADSGVLGDDSIALKMYSNADEWLDVLSLDGATRLTVELEDDRGWAVSGSGNIVWAYLLEFEPPDFSIPFLVMHEIDLTSGQVRESRHPLVDRTGEPLITTGCYPSRLDRGLLRCGTQGTTLEISVGLSSSDEGPTDQGVALPGFISERRVERSDKN
jgi:hypothetical protein